MTLWQDIIDFHIRKAIFFTNINIVCWKHIILNVIGAKVLSPKKRTDLFSITLSSEIVTSFFWCFITLICFKSLISFSFYFSGILCFSLQILKLISLFNQCFLNNWNFLFNCLYNYFPIFVTLIHN